MPPPDPTAPLGNPKFLERLTFFSDAVFAIALTLLIIEVHAPDRIDPFTDGALWSAIGHAIPGLLAFAISFIVIATFWSTHHRAFALLAHADGALVARNFVMLFAIAVLPYPTGIIARFATLGAGQRAYLLALLFAALAQLLLFRHALRPRYLAADVAHAASARLLRRATALPLVVTIAFLATFIDPRAGLPALALIPIVLHFVSRGIR